MKTVILISCLFLAGCNTLSETAPRVVVTPTGPKTEAQLTAFRQQLEILTVQLQTQRDLADRAAAAVYGATDANTHNPDGLAKEATSAQLEEATSALPEAKPEVKLAKAAQNARILAGELVAVRAEMGQTVNENKALQASLLDAQRREADALRTLAQATAAGELERREAAGKLQKQFDDMTARITAAQDEANNKVMLEQVKDLNRGAAICAGLLVLTVGLAIAFGGPAALKAVWPFAALLLIGALVCYGLAQIVGLWWFKYGVLGVLLLILALCAWWVVRHYRLGTLQADTADKAEKLKNVLSQTVPVLDAAYKNATQEFKDFMDRHIFGVLNDKMDAADKAAVHELRAEQTAQP